MKNKKKLLVLALSAALGASTLYAGVIPEACASEASLTAEDDAETPAESEAAEPEALESEAAESEAAEPEALEAEATEAKALESEATEAKAEEEIEEEIIEEAEEETVEEEAVEEETVEEETIEEEEADNSKEQVIEHSSESDGLMAALSSMDGVEVVKPGSEAHTTSVWVNPVSESDASPEEPTTEEILAETSKTAETITITEEEETVVAVPEEEEFATVIESDGSAWVIATRTADVLNTQINVSGNEYYTDIETAGKDLRSALKSHATGFAAFYRSSTRNDAIIKDIYYEACKHTGKATEGDYLIWQVEKTTMSADLFELNGKFYYQIFYNLRYYTTSSQEKTLTSKINSLKKSLKIKSTDSDYTTVKKIYDYICKNVTYDNYHLRFPTYTLQYTAYAALVNKTAVCQGYALLFYRLALEAGIDARLIGGTSRGEGHAWNIVCLNGKYYNVDATWDAQCVKAGLEYQYFLKCNSHFTDHKRNGASGSYYNFTTAAFNKTYPMSTKDFSTTDQKAPAKPVISSVKNSSSKKMKVSWKRISAATGYELFYATNAKFSKAKKISIGKNTTISKTISKLVKGKTYYVRMRSYKKVGSKKVYSSYSKTKSVKIKK